VPLTLPLPLPLHPHLRLRPPGPDELVDVHRLIAARDTADLGRVDFTLDDLRDEWAMADFDAAADARVAEDDGGELLGYGAVDRRGALVVVPPEHEGRGVGTALRQFVEARERALGRPVHRQGVAAANAAAAALLRDAGYALIRSYARMVRALSAVRATGPGASPPGITIRSFDRDRDARMVHAIDDATFMGAPDYLPESFGVFCGAHLDVHDFDDEASLVACRDGELTGFLLARRWTAERAGFVNILAVRPEDQGRGIGSSLLRTAFAIWAAADLAEAQLGVSLVNPRALRLYQGLGMHERWRIDIYERPVG
jgi:mycothiol synthase